MKLQHIGAKLFLENPSSLAMIDFIPVFHSWIQKQAVESHLLIDVHNYSHVQQGPGILLVAHEGNFSVDSSEGRLGLLYYRKKPLSGPLEDRIRAVFRVTLQACRSLEESPSLEGVRFRTDELRMVANDRLLAPNTDGTFQEVEPALSNVTGRLFQTDCTLTRLEDPRERFTVTVKTAPSESLETLLERLV